MENTDIWKLEEDVLQRLIDQLWKWNENKDSMRS